MLLAGSCPPHLSLAPHQIARRGKAQGMPAWAEQDEKSRTGQFPQAHPGRPDPHLCIPSQFQRVICILLAVQDVLPWNSTLMLCPRLPRTSVPSAQVWLPPPPFLLVNHPTLPSSIHKSVHSPITSSLFPLLPRLVASDVTRDWCRREGHGQERRASALQGLQVPQDQ